MATLAFVALIVVTSITLILSVINAQQGKFGVRKALRMMGLLTILSAIACIVLVMIEPLTREPEPLPFTVEGWNGPYTEPNGNFTYTRYRMVRDLLRQYEFRGWSLEQVVALLGKPEKVTTQDGQTLVSYDLGNGLDFLIFEADTHQTVTVTRIHKH
jgi:hypothetical protein